MRVDIVPACLRDTSYVFANMRPLDETEVRCQVPLDVKMHELAWSMLEGSEAFVARYKGVPVMVYGTAPMNVACLSVWAIGTAKTFRVLPAVTRHMIHDHLPERLKQGFVTMEARSHVDHTEAHRWMESTGAVAHGDPFVYGRDRQKFLLFRWTPEAFDTARRKYARKP